MGSPTWWSWGVFQRLLGHPSKRQARSVWAWGWSPEGEQGRGSWEWGGEEPHLALPPVLLEEVEASPPGPGLLQPQQSPWWRQPGPNWREGQAQTLSQGRPRPQARPQGFLLDLPFHYLRNDAVQDVGDPVILRAGSNRERGSGPADSQGGPTQPQSVPTPPAPPQPLAHTGQGRSDRGESHVYPLMPQAEFDSSGGQQLTERGTRQGPSAGTALCRGLCGVRGLC